MEREKHRQVMLLGERRLRVEITSLAESVRKYGNYMGPKIFGM